LNTLESKIYKCLVMHNRLSPKKHRFTYNIFMFWLDIDSIDEVAQRMKLFSRNRSNIFNFRDDDHFKFPKGDQRNKLDTRTKLNNYLRENGIAVVPSKVFLLTHVRMFGHVFNPVSFYYCYDEQGKCNFVVTEISNTFREMKLFLIDQKKGEQFEQNAIKYFYVSPFTDMDTEFEFRYHVPDEKLNIQINVNDQLGKKFFISTLTGKEKKLRDWRLAGYVFRFPFVTVKVITAIHWQALKLWLKKLPFHKKKNNSDLQKGITNV
ncbi:MAG: DUF1365 domain-containing protein, partial [Chitinophagales bacterium]